VLRRRKSGDEPLTYADLTINQATREVRRGEHIIDLTAREYELLLLLMRHARLVLTREQILDQVWGYSGDAETNVLEVHVGHMRQKLEAHGGSRLIQTIRGVGYTLRE
jgi:two-component system response regulator MprA